METLETKICQMYSYKGGSGRTVATANISSILVKEHNKKVVCIDMDMEGAGLGVVFKIHKIAANESKRKYIQDIFKERITSSNDFIENWWPKMHFDIGKVLKDPGLEDKLFIIPARFGTQVIESGEETGNQFSIFLESIQDKIQPDIILLDSASGFQDWATLGMEFSTLMTLFFRWSYQSIEGTIEAVKFIIEQDTSIEKILLVPSMVPKESLVIKKYRNLLESGEERLRVETDARKRDEIQIFEGGISEAVGLKWEEKILNTEKNLESDEENALSDYRKVAQDILKM